MTLLSVDFLLSKGFILRSGQYILEVQLPFPGKREIVGFTRETKVFVNYNVNGIWATNNIHTEEKLTALLEAVSLK